MSQSKPAPYNVAKWLPSDQKFLDQWLKNLIEKVDGKKPVVDDLEEEEGESIVMVKLHPVVKEFKILIRSDQEVYMFFHQMFNQVIHTEDPTGEPQVKNFHQMLRLINDILTTAPEYNKTGLVGFPINAILNWPMATVGGFSCFLNDKVNAQLKKILNQWGVYLKSPDSTYVLSDDPTSGWFGRDALEAMPGFAEDYKCDPSAPHYGFTSWDDFFTRVFREGIRPVASPEDDNIIANACESAPYALQKNVKRRSSFWMKSQEYSLEFMLGNDPLVSKFVGGTVYQAFLSALSYHRWHSPVNGTVLKTVNLDGSYYSATFRYNILYDPASPNKSQGYLTQVAARALIFIEADNPLIGLMCFMAIGMAEVSSNEITVYEGQHVTKGQEIGMFHFGGSTHCLIFRPGVYVTFTLGQEPGLHSENINVRSKIAVVTGKEVRHK